MSVSFVVSELRTSSCVTYPRSPSASRVWANLAVNDERAAHAALLPPRTCISEVLPLPEGPMIATT